MEVYQYFTISNLSEVVKYLKKIEGENEAILSS